MGFKLIDVDISLIERIVPELSRELVGRAFREAIQLAPDQFVFIFEDDELRMLLVSVNAHDVRGYVIRRRLRDLKKQKVNPSKFVVDVSKQLAGKRLAGLSQISSERILDLKFETGEGLVVQLTGKSSNVFLLDSSNVIVTAAQKPGSVDQSTGKRYSPPIRIGSVRERLSQFEIPDDVDTISAFLDGYFQRLDTGTSFEKLAEAAQRKNRNEAKKLFKLISNLKADLVEHGDAERWKRFGDLLLANASTLQRRGTAVLVPDLFDEASPIIEIEVDENDSIADAAQKYFRRYTKSRNAVAEIENRIRSAEEKTKEVEAASQAIEKAISQEDAAFLNSIIGGTKLRTVSKKESAKSRLPSGIRSFVSSDGFEILVGKKAADNDVLTFKVANSRDTWMHAADYPGSHVVVRNPDRKPIPQRTLIEAAQLAAFNSQGKKQVKAAVHYTERKFVNKPKGAAPGLVRLASFKTILVEPSMPAVMKD